MRLCGAKNDKHAPIFHTFEKCILCLFRQSLSLVENENRWFTVEIPVIEFRHNIAHMLDGSLRRSIEFLKTLGALLADSKARITFTAWFTILYVVANNGACNNAC